LGPDFSPITYIRSQPPLILNVEHFGIPAEETSPFLPPFSAATSPSLALRAQFWREQASETLHAAGPAGIVGNQIFGERLTRLLASSPIDYFSLKLYDYFMKMYNYFLNKYEYLVPRSTTFSSSYDYFLVIVAVFPK
jgi:hypothetical protein